MASDGGDWKPSGRPTSMIARNFSADLNEAFATDSSLDGLVQSVQLKKEAVNSQTQELQALEARLRETEERLKERQSRDPSPAGRKIGTELPSKHRPFDNTYAGEEKNRLGSSTTSTQSRQVPASQTVSSSTMSRWRPTQDTASGTGTGHTGSESSMRPNELGNSRYAS